MQLAKLKEEYAIHCANTQQNRVKLFSLRRKLLKADLDCARESYKSELAEQSLTMSINH